MSDEQVVVKEEEEKVPQEELPRLLASLPGGPTQEDIERWKLKHGEVFVSGFSETELYVFRPVTRKEYVRLQQLAADPQSGLTQNVLEEMLCDMCTLFPAKENRKPWDEGKAGTPEILHMQIMQNSNFMSPQGASMLVAKL